MTVSELPADARKRALELPNYLIECGVPVFCAPPRTPKEIEDSKSEFNFPRGWQNAVANPKTLTRWKPGWAVCAVTGVLFDVIDVDPRNGGLDSYQALKEAELLPPTFGEIKTPSGGMHLYVGRSGLHKGTPALGVDLQAGGDDAPPFTKGRGFVYITPTCRISKTDGVMRLYSETVPLNLEGIQEASSDPEFKPWLEFLTARLGKAEEPHRDPPWTRKEPHDTREQAYVMKMMGNITARMAAAQVGERNNTLNKSAFYLGRVCAGCGIPVSWAKDLLRQAATLTGLTKSDIEYRLKRSFSQGISAPLAVGPFKPEEKARREELERVIRDSKVYLEEYDLMCDEYIQLEGVGE